MRKNTKLALLMYFGIVEVFTGDGTMFKKLSDKTKFNLSQFGVVFTLFILVIHLASKNGHDLFIYLAALLLVITLLFYRVLMPLNNLWLKFGSIMGHVFGSLILGGVFYIVLTPLALLRKLSGNKTMVLDFSKDSPSYWTARKVKEVSRKDFEHQF